MKRVVTMILAATAAASLSSCASPETEVTPFKATAIVGELVDGYDCTAPNLRDFQEPRPESDVENAPARMRVPSGFTPAYVYRCNVISSVGERSEPSADRLDGDLNALLTVLAMPDSDVPDGTDEFGAKLCTPVEEILPELWLVDLDGQAMRAQWPTNACAKTLPGNVEILSGFVATRVDASGP